ncbi:MAG: AsmA-like C-terminal domain-containing protein [Pseudomonadota bacterium]
MSDEKSKKTPDKAPKKSNLKKFGLIGLEIGVLCLLLICVAVGTLAWRMSHEPLDIGFAKPYIQGAVKDAQAGFDLDMDEVFLEWPDFSGPILIGLGNARLIGEDNTEILNIDSAGIGVSYPHLLIGSVRPTAIIIKGPSLRIERTRDDLGISLQDYELPDDDVDEESAGDWRQEVALRLTEIADNQFAQGTFFSNLDKVEVREARVVVHDQVTGLSRYFTDMDASLLRSDEGAALSFNVVLPSRASEQSSFSMKLDYIKNRGLFQFGATMQNINPFLFGELFHHAKIFEGQDVKVSGNANVLLDRVLNPTAGQINLQSPEGELVFEGEYREPLAYKDAKARLNYSLAESRMQIEDLSIVVNDVPVSLSSNTIIGDDKITVPVVVNIPEVSAENAAALIPQSEMESDGGEWVGQKLRDGIYKYIVVNVLVEADRQNVVGEFGPKREWIWGVKDTFASFAFENMTIDYSDTLTPATKAIGTGEFDGDNLVIKGESAYVGDVHGTNLDMTFSDFMVVGGGVADITMDVTGPLPSYLKFLALDPINLGDDIGLNPNQGKGTLTAKLDVSFPTLKELPKDEVVVVVDGTLSDLNLPDMVQGLPLTGGPVSLNVADGKVVVKGDAQLANRDVTLDWTQYLDSTGQAFSMQVKAQLGADQQLRNHFGIDLDDFIQGTLPIDLVFTERPNGSATIDLKGDLAPIKIDIDPFDYIKETGVAGSLSLKVNLQNEVLKTITNLSLKTQDLSVENATLGFRQLQGTEVELATANLPSAEIGRTRQSAEVEIDPQNQWTVKARGSIFDAGPFLKDEVNDGTVPEDNPSFVISLNADTMLTKKEQSIQKVNLYTELNKRGNVDALEVDAFAGQGTIQLRYKPDANGQRNFDMQATDAGATLKAFDIFPDVIGGTIRIYGEPVGGRDSDDIYGTAQMTDFKVVNAPALARLINAMSISGLDGALTQGGLSFTNLEGTFEWLFRPQGSLITIKNGRTSGSSLGLSFDGKIDRASQTIDIKGTIVPLSGVNDIIGSIPLVGDILTGGSGLIAATYTMRGPAAEPKVAINPLSVLTPGFLRRILFEGGFEEGSAPRAPREPRTTNPTSEELLNQPALND